MDEYIELLDKHNKPSGQRILKSEAHRIGLHHASVHIWFFTDKNEVLLQKRHASKLTFPNLWDISVAGHIAHSELPLAAAIREIEEEIGITTNEKALRNIGTSNHKHTHPNGIIDYELHHIYIARLKSNLSDLKIQEEEVSEIKLIPIDVLKFELKNNKESYVPHGEDYYNRIFDAIKQFKQNF